MAEIASLFYGAIAYLVFVATLLYAVAFVGNLPVPKTVDSGEAGPLGPALVVDLLLLGLFAVQHSVMARPWFKHWWTRVVPKPVERSTYVLFASLVLLILYWQWRPISAPIWSVTNPAGIALLWAVFWSGWALALASTFLINHFELFGLHQVYARLRGRALPPPTFDTPGFYRWIRHPLYLGFLLAFWATPAMSGGHLLFAAAMTGYILIAIQFEERDLIGLFGDQYRRYREQVSMLFPWPAGRAAIASARRVQARQR
jgi:protein-S-isoprenylcysteine O-methyltransferase Ste14